MPCYAQLQSGTCVSVTETHSPLPESPDLIALDDYDTSILGKHRIDGQWVAPAAVVTKRMTKAAFQARFPRSADGISSKFDLMLLFLSDGDYSTYLVPDAATRFGLKALITAGKNKLDSSLSVDLAVTDAAMFTGLLMQASIPTAFRLTAAERDAVLRLPVTEAEAYK